MNVAGGGLAGFVSVMIFMIGLVPLLITLILNNLGVFKGLPRLLRVLAYCISYFLLLALELFLFRWLKYKLSEGFFYFTLYAILLLLLTYAFRKVWAIYLKWMVPVITVIVIFIIYFSVRPANRNSNPLFEKQFVDALNLQYISRDSLYSANTLIISKDTIAGFYNANHPDIAWEKQPKCFFSQSIRNLKYRKLINMTGWMGTEYSVSYQNRAIFVNGTGKGHLVRMIYPDTTEAEALTNPDINFDLVTKRIVFKNKIVICGTGKFAIYDYANEALLYSGQGFCFSTLMDNKLVFIDSSNDGLIVNCLDLDRMKIIWMTKADGMHLTENHLFADPKNAGLMFNQNGLAIVTEKGLQMLDKVNGRLIKNFPMPDITKSFICYQLDREKIYLSANDTLECKDAKSLKKKWIIKGARLYGSYKEYVIGISADNKKYIIADAATGKITQTIPINQDINVRFIDKYVLISSLNAGNLYQ